MEFKFNRSLSTYLPSIKDHYEEIMTRYMKEVLNSKETIKLKFTNLDKSYLGNNGIKEGNDSSILSFLNPYTDNLFVHCNIPNKGITIFSFLIYGQNNCCGAATISKSCVSENYKYRKIGTLIQHLKEDIALCKDISLLTCTDEFYYRPEYNTIEEINEEYIKNLKPYNHNSKVLLTNGWKVSELFYNRNSHNIVALYTKKINRLESNLEITMKISQGFNELIKIKNVTIGADPELFLRSKELGDYIPSFFVMKGDKNNPTAISDEGHNIQCDNVMVEYGIPPSKTEAEFIKHNLFVQDYIKDKVATPNGLDMVIFPFARFDENNLLNEKATHFGCSPDYNAWNGGEPNTVGRVGTTGRCAGKIVCQA